MKCKYCGKEIPKGHDLGEDNFCNDKCGRNYYMLQDWLSENVPDRLR